MTDYNPYDPSAAPEPSGEAASPAHPPFPWLRLAYSAGFALAAYCTFWIALLFAALQFVTVLIAGAPNAELRGINQAALRYLQQLFDYIIFVREELPFPFAPFPKP